MLASGSLGASLSALGFGAVLAAGQWLIAVLGMAGIGALAAGRLEPETVTSFRLVIVYSVMVAMLCSAPVTLVVTRLFSDALHDEQPEVAPGLMIGAVTLVIGLTGALAAAIFAAMGLRGGLLVAGIAVSVQFGQLWTIAAFSSAVAQIGWVVASYAVGTAVSLGASLSAGARYGTVQAMVWGYAAGLALITVLLMLRFLRSFPFGWSPPIAALGSIWAGLRQHRTVALGALAGAAGLWADKWVLWAYAPGIRDKTGLWHLPVYDAAVFLGLLSIIPGLALLVIQLETQFFRQVRRHIAQILDHAPLAEIDRAAEAIADQTRAALHQGLLVQATLAFALIAACQGLAEAGLIRFVQVPIVGLVLVGTVFLSLSAATSGLLLYLDRPRAFCGVQGVFLGSILIWTLVLLGDPRWLGLSFALASMAAGITGYILANDALRHLNGHLFLNSVLNGGRRRPAPTR